MKNYVLCFHAVLMAVACTKQLPAPEPDCLIQVPVSMKAETPVFAADPGGVSESTVNTLQVFVFRENGTLEACEFSEGTGASFECTVGRKIVAAIANAPELPGIKSKSDIEKAVSSLQDNAPDSFVMYGSSSEDITEAGGEISLRLSRLVARVSVGKVTNRLAPDVYKSSEFRIERMYLVNVAGNALYSGGAFTPSLWYNKLACLGGGDCPSLLGGGDRIDRSVAHGASYDTGHSFYCYPNPSSADLQTAAWAARFTRLVLEVSIDGILYYYPVSLEGIESNHSYHISELTVTRLGSGSPDIPVSVGTVSFSISVADWSEGFDKDVTI